MLHLGCEVQDAASKPRLVPKGWSPCKKQYRSTSDNLEEDPTEKSSEEDIACVYGNQTIIKPGY